MTPCFHQGGVGKLSENVQKNGKTLEGLATPTCDRPMGDEPEAKLLGGAIGQCQDLP